MAQRMETMFNQPGRETLSASFQGVEMTHTPKPVRRQRYMPKNFGLEATAAESEEERRRLEREAAAEQYTAQLYAVAEWINYARQEQTHEPLEELAIADQGQADFELAG